MTPTVPVLDSDKEWAMIEAQLPDDWRELAKEAELVPKNPPPGAKVKDVADVESVLRLIFYHVATTASLRTTAAMGAAAAIITMSSVALHLWMKKIGPFVETLLERVTSTQDTFAAKRWAGYDIHLVDASTVQKPGAIKTTSRIHYAMRLTSLEPTQIIVTTEKVGETFKHFDSEDEQLYIGDRAYSNPPGIASMDSQGAHVLVRYNRSALPLYDSKGNSLDVFQCFRKLRKRGPVREWMATVHPANTAPIKGRLIMVRLPTDKAKEARERTQKEYRRKGRTLSSKALQAAEFVVVFTTIPKDRLNKDQVMELYRLRWQVELAFKREKSITGLDELPNFREDTIHTWICTKLLLSQIARRIAGPNVLLPNSSSPKPAAMYRPLLLNLEQDRLQEETSIATMLGPLAGGLLRESGQVSGATAYRNNRGESPF